MYDVVAVYADYFIARELFAHDTEGSCVISFVIDGDEKGFVDEDGVCVGAVFACIPPWLGIGVVSVGAWRHLDANDFVGVVECGWVVV